MHRGTEQHSPLGKPAYVVTFSKQRHCYSDRLTVYCRTVWSDVCCDVWSGAEARRLTYKWRSLLKTLPYLILSNIYRQAGQTDWQDHYLLTYSLTPYSKVLLEKLTGSQPVKKFPTFYGTRRFITAFTNARHLSISWGSSIQSIPPTSHFLKIHLNIILSSTPGSPKWSAPPFLTHWGRGF
jgi:hypothetical protein